MRKPDNNLSQHLEWLRVTEANIPKKEEVLAFLPVDDDAASLGGGGSGVRPNGQLDPDIIDTTPTNDERNARTMEETPLRQTNGDTNATPMTIDLTIDEEERRQPGPKTTPVTRTADYSNIQKILEDDDDETDDFAMTESNTAFEVESSQDEMDTGNGEIEADDAQDRGRNAVEIESPDKVDAEGVQKNHSYGANNNDEPVSVLRKRAQRFATPNNSATTQERVVDSILDNIASSPIQPPDAADLLPRKFTDSQYELLNRYHQSEKSGLYEKIAILERIADDRTLSKSDFSSQLTALNKKIEFFHDRVQQFKESNDEAQEFLQPSPHRFHNPQEDDVILVDDDDDDDDIIEHGSNRVNEFSDPMSDDDEDDEMLNEFLRNRQFATPTKQTNNNTPIEIPESPIGHQIHSSPQGIQGPQVNSQVQTGYLTRHYPWDNEVSYVLKHVFKLPSFRQNQKEAINATLDGKDVLVLMPTGGGKSLCYQLPALVKGGNSQGVTVVISPLISLMQDQVEQLKSKGISADVINSKCTGPEKTERFHKLSNGELDLLYLSPEMLGASVKMNRTLHKLCNENQVARFVIDEAHCVSSWGHDFRTDYKELEKLKIEFPSVPIMALTATATRPVQLDITQCLREDPVFLKQTFNRPNLYYEVREKKSVDSAIEQIKELITGQFAGKTGIIYCHSRKSCEDTSMKLQKEGLRVDYYHGGMDPSQREKVQEFWQKGYVTTICATIAFGMGIDKPDVRYVIHLTMPQTMEGYYQETGRAGRDGKPSTCVLFYSYKDASMMKRLLSMDPDMTPEHKMKMLELFRKIVLYCEEVGICRRQQILEYFEEVFDPANCNKTCDNCKSNVAKDWVKRDVTDYAKYIIEMVGAIQKTTVPLGHCIDVFRGSKKKSVVESGHDKLSYHGKGKDLDNTTADRIFHGLLAEGYLQEYQKYSGRFAQSYLKRTEESKKLLNGQRKVIMRFPDLSKDTANGSGNSSRRGRTSGAAKNRTTTTMGDHGDDADLFRDDYDSAEDMRTSQFFGTQAATFRSARDLHAKSKSTKKFTPAARKRKGPSTSNANAKKRNTMANPSTAANKKQTGGRFDAMPI